MEHLIIVIVEHVLGSDYHLALFFKKDWSAMANIISFGHDIEASWLLWKATKETGNTQLCEKIKPLVLKIAETSLLEGFDPIIGAMENEIHDRAKNPPHAYRDCTRIWWCQSEAMVGFFNAYQLSKDDRFLDASHRQWLWIKTYQ